MNNENKIKGNILESIVVICIMSIYIVYGVHYLPLLIFLIPVPFVILGLKNGFTSNITSLVITLLIVQILLSSTSGASLMIAFAPLSLCLNYAIKSRKSRIETLLISTASFIVPFVILILLGIEVANIDLIKEAETILNQILGFQIDALKEIGMTNYEILQIKDMFESARNELLVLIPSFISIFSFLIAYINFSVVGFGFRKMGYGVVSSGSFSRFKLPNNIIPGIGIMLVTALLFKLLNVNYHEALLLNITFLVAAIFLAQGLAVLDFLLKKKKKKLVFRIIILGFALLFIPAHSILFFMGLFDSIFDIRKIRIKKS